MSQANPNHTPQKLTTLEIDNLADHLIAHAISRLTEDEPEHKSAC
jgi:hypothetical protein